MEPPHDNGDAGMTGRRSARKSASDGPSET
jgi:hypothetical protein